jgi:hypothetical protein
MAVGSVFIAKVAILFVVSRVAKAGLSPQFIQLLS